jgi:hypothetical protein
MADTGLSSYNTFKSSIQTITKDILIFHISTKVGQRLGPGVIGPTSSILGLVGTVYSLAILELKKIDVALYQDV